MALTQMCTPRGGIETDVTVTLLAPGRYYVVSAAATETHDLDWIERHAPDDGSVRIDNVTARFGVLTVAGPRSRELLQRVSRDDFSAEGFRFFRARHVEIGLARVLALRVSYVGELGWELHHPIEAQRPLYEALVAAGEDLGLVDFGYRALESMRFEKCYRLWGADMSADWSPLQAGMERFVAFDKGDFIGRDALLREREQGSTHTLACLVVDVDGVDAHGLEPIYADAARPIAYVASGGYGHTIERSIALAYLPVEHAAIGTELTVGILGDRRRAVVSEQPLLDPAGRTPLRLDAPPRAPGPRRYRRGRGNAAAARGRRAVGQHPGGVRRRPHRAARCSSHSSRSGMLLGSDGPGGIEFDDAELRARGRHHRARADPLRGRSADLVAAAAAGRRARVAAEHRGRHREHRADRRGRARAARRLLARGVAARRGRRVDRCRGRLRDAALHAHPAAPGAHARGRVGRQRPDGDRADARADRLDRAPRRLRDRRTSRCSSCSRSASACWSASRSAPWRRASSPTCPPRSAPSRRWPRSRRPRSRSGAPT